MFVVGMSPGFDHQKTQIPFCFLTFHFFVGHRQQKGTGLLGVQEAKGHFKQESFHKKHQNIALNLCLIRGLRRGCLSSLPLPSLPPSPHDRSSTPAALAFDRSLLHGVQQLQLQVLILQDLLLRLNGQGVGLGLWGIRPKSLQIWHSEEVSVQVVSTFKVGMESNRGWRIQLSSLLGCC